MSPSLLFRWLRRKGAAGCRCGFLSENWANCFSSAVFCPIMNFPSIFCLLVFVCLCLTALAWIHLILSIVLLLCIFFLFFHAFFFFFCSRLKRKLARLSHWSGKQEGSRGSLCNPEKHLHEHANKGEFVHWSWRRGQTRVFSEPTHTHTNTHRRC